MPRDRESSLVRTVRARTRTLEASENVCENLQAADHPD